MDLQRRASFYRRRANMSSYMARLPGDLLLELTTFLHSRSDILHLSMSCSRLFANICPALYTDVQLDSVIQCSVTLDMLFRRPDIARHVQKLFVRPDGSWSSQQSSLANGYQVSRSIRQLAAKLDALNTFVWDGEEMPPLDDMWFALRIYCPRLRTIGMTVGSLLPSPRSHIFDFSNLEGFSVTLKRGFFIEDVFTEGTSISTVSTVHRLWDMLIRNCPDLQELYINGAASQPADAEQLCRGRWPHLKKLVIGDLVLDWRNPNTNPHTKHPFIAFLESHKELKTLQTSRHAINPIHLSTLDRDALPYIEEFSGTLDQLHVISAMHSRIKIISFNDAMVIRDLAPMVVSSVLQGMHSLTMLNISFIFHSMYESGSLLRSLIAACPHLLHLELTCGRSPSFQLVSGASSIMSARVSLMHLAMPVLFSQDSFAKSLRNLSRLRSLVLTLVRMPGEEPLSVCASHIARANPRLSIFTITFIPSSLALPLSSPLPFKDTKIPTDLPYNSSSAIPFAHRHHPPTHEFVESGTYTTTMDLHGLPALLTCVERRGPVYNQFSRIREAFAWLPARWYQPLTRRYVVDLRPRRTASGLISLLLERSAAGEETRLLFVLMSLGWLAVSGFMAFETKGLAEYLW